MATQSKSWSVRFFQFSARVLAAAGLVLSPLVIVGAVVAQSLPVVGIGLMWLLIGLVAGAVDVGIEYLANLDNASRQSADALTRIVESQSKRSAK